MAKKNAKNTQHKRQSLLNSDTASATPQPMPASSHVPPGYQMPGHQMPGVPQVPAGYPMPAGQQMPASHMMQQPPVYSQMAASQAQMMQMMQMMMGAHMGIPGIDPAAQPFHPGETMEEEDAGLDSDIIRPHQLRSVIKRQQPLPIHEILDCLCLTENGQYALGGIPKGCTIAFVGPPGQGKTRTAIAALCRVAYSGTRCAFVVAEEGFIDTQNSGRDDLSSRLTKIGMKALGLSEAKFQKTVARNIAVIQSQYHKGHTWDSFVSRYRFLIEKEEVKFVIIDSLNTLDPSKTKTADNLSALKTYNHEKGVSCLTIGQIKDTGMPVGGEALIHTADAVFLLEEISLTSKDMAEFWGGKYREKITVIRAIKSVTTPIFPYPIRVDQDSETGTLKMHPGQPAQYQPFALEPSADA